MRIVLACEETSGLDLCVEFIWIEAVILIENRWQVTANLSWNNIMLVNEIYYVMIPWQELAGRHHLLNLFGLPGQGWFVL